MIIVICYLIEDSTGKIGKIQTVFRKRLKGGITLKWVDDSGKAKDEKPIFNAQYLADDNFLDALAELEDAADSIFLIDLALNDDENKRIIRIQEHGGTFQANTAAKIIRRLQSVYPSAKVMLTTYITGLSVNSAWKKMLLDLPEEDPLSEDDLNKVDFISSAVFELANYEDYIFERFSAF